MTDEQLITHAKLAAQDLRNLAPLFSPTLSPNEIRAAMITMTKFVHDCGPAIAVTLDELASRLQSEGAKGYTQGFKDGALTARSAMREDA
jgi:hypothetical protein